MADQYTTELNGFPFTYTAEVETSALEVIREQAKITGTKLVCGSGACGACTVMVNGEGRCSCLMPAHHMAGKKVTTVEGQAHGQDLHPVQYAFLANDALQCGYCTPGFVNEAIAFYDEWTRKNAFKRPSRDEVAAALAGHYCRCGAYQGVFAAVQEACEGKYDHHQTFNLEYRADGNAKVTGSAKYTTDQKPENTLVGMVYRSPYPRARLLKLDLSPALAIPGVAAAIRYKEDDLSNFAGEAIAAIAATSDAIAHQALKAIQVEWEPLDFVLGIENAMKASAPVLVPGNEKSIPLASEAPPFPGKWTGNVRKTNLSLTSSQKGKANKTTEKADTKGKNYFSGTFNTPTQFHTTLEPHCAVADWKPEKLTVYASTQAVHYLAKDIAEHYDLKEENVQVVAHHVGGAFGSKLMLHTEIKLAVELSRAAEKPVAMIYSRAEEFTEAGYRPPVQLNLTLTADEDGQNPAYTLEAFADSGYAIGSNVADISGLNYTGIAKALQDHDVLTNFQPGAAFRGPGGPAALFALEQGMDQLAHQLNLDPIAFRRKWETHEGYLALFDWVEKQPVWQNRHSLPTQAGRFTKGVGVAFGGWFHLYMPSAQVKVALKAGKLEVYCSVQDMGQGSRTVLAQAVSEVFQISPQKVEVVIGESNLPKGPTSGGSRTTASIYPAAREAAEKLKKTLFKSTQKTLSLEDAQLVEAGIFHKGGNLPWVDAFRKIGDAEETVTRGHNHGFNPMGLVPLAQGLELGQNRGYGVYIVEVEVDRLLGKTHVTQVAGALRVGKIHVPMAAQSQCYGGVIQGIGHVLYEDREVCPERGIVLSRGLEDYRIPGIGDMPAVRIEFIEEGFDMVKQKGIGLAELCTIPVAGAVANAIFHATGVRHFTAPITPERMLASLKNNH